MAVHLSSGQRNVPITSISCLEPPPAGSFLELPVSPIPEEAGTESNRETSTMGLSWRTNVIKWTDNTEISYRWFAGGDPVLDVEEINTGRQDTLLVARINKEYVGKFQSGLYGQHAEESMLQQFKLLWRKMLQEGVVWRPTKDKPFNVLSLHLTRSPCGPSGHDCGASLIQFVKEMNMETAENIQGYNPMGVRWNLRLRIKARRIYGQSNTEILESKSTIRALIDSGIGIRPWDILTKAQTDKRKDGGVHELAGVSENYFDQRERATAVSGQTMKSKIKNETMNMSVFLQSVYKEQLGEYFNEPMVRSTRIVKWLPPVVLETDFRVEEEIKFLTLEAYKLLKSQIGKRLVELEKEFLLANAPLASDKSKYDAEFQQEYRKYRECLSAQYQEKLKGFLKQIP